MLAAVAGLLAACATATPYQARQPPINYGFPRATDRGQPHPHQLPRQYADGAGNGRDLSALPRRRADAGKRPRLFHRRRSRHGRAHAAFRASGLRTGRVSRSTIGTSRPGAAGAPGTIRSGMSRASYREVTQLRGCRRDRHVQMARKPRTTIRTPSTRATFSANLQGRITRPPPAG